MSTQISCSFGLSFQKKREFSPRFSEREIIFPLCSLSDLYISHLQQSKVAQTNTIPSSLEGLFGQEPEMILPYVI